MQSSVFIKWRIPRQGIHPFPILLLSSQGQSQCSSTSRTFLAKWHQLSAKKRKLLVRVFHSCPQEVKLLKWQCCSEHKERPKSAPRYDSAMLQTTCLLVWASDVARKCLLDHLGLAWHQAGWKGSFRLLRRWLCTWKPRGICCLPCWASPLNLMVQN